MSRRYQWSCEDCGAVGKSQAVLSQAERLAASHVCGGNVRVDVERAHLLYPSTRGLTDQQWVAHMDSSGLFWHRMIRSFESLAERTPLQRRPRDDW